jgi:hypothetical protein
MKPQKGRQYLPTINLWDAAIITALRNGQLKLQCGQWVKCGSKKPSRFVAMKTHSVWAAHPEGNLGTKKSFRRLLNVHKEI